MSLECDLKSGEVPLYNSGDEATPQWIRLPKELGGKRAKVIDNFVAKQCICNKHPARVYILDGEYAVVECLTKGFAWIKKPDDISSFKRGLM